MSIFQISILGAIFAGLAMVVGGIALIYKGALVLAAADKVDALTIEWKQNFRINTQAPGLAFFLVGLLFILLAVVASKPSKIEPVKIIGKVTGINDPITVTATTEPWSVSVASDGQIDGLIFPNVRRLTIEISAPGYVPIRQPFDVPVTAEGMIELKSDITLKRQVPTIVGRAENIVEVKASLPPLNAPPAFGRGAP
ncbi:MAG: hypothetical protein ACREVL_15130 [Solimonas sp.]